MSRYGIINADMFGTESSPGEHIDWSAPDVMTRQEWADLLGQSLETYAAENPHMIVFGVNLCNAFGIGCGGHFDPETLVCSTCGALNG